VGVGGDRSRESGMSRPLNPKETECSDVPNKRRSRRRRSTAVAAHSADMTDTYTTSWCLSGEHALELEDGGRQALAVENTRDTVRPTGTRRDGRLARRVADGARFDVDDEKPPCCRRPSSMEALLVHATGHRSLWRTRSALSTRMPPSADTQPVGVHR
jgi:hypothetical protein